MLFNFLQLSLNPLIIYFDQRFEVEIELHSLPCLLSLTVTLTPLINLPF